MSLGLVGEYQPVWNVYILFLCSFRLLNCRALRYMEVYLYTVLYSNSFLSQCMQMYWKTFDCTADPLIISYAKCIIVEPERSLLFAESTFNQELVKPNATFTLFILRESSKRYHKIFYMNVDICNLFKTPLQNQIVLAVYKGMLEHSNVPEKCPVAKVSIGFILFLFISYNISVITFQGNLLLSEH